jgi:hypothetical protein
MQCANALEATIALGAVGLAVCTDLKPHQVDVADLNSQVGKLQSEVELTRNSADRANDMPQASGGFPESDQSTSNQAVAGAQAAESDVEATNGENFR